jgi:hypothetical protein
MQRISSKMELEPSSEIKAGTAYKQVCLGVLGKREDISREAFFDKIIHPLMELLGRMPDIVYLPSDGMSSALVGAWADRCGVKTETLTAEWHRLGRKAVALRDSRILKSSTHLLIFEQPKSEYTVKLGIREFKKGKSVYSVSAGKTWELLEWQAENSCNID